MIGIGLIGAGRMGRVYARLLATGIEGARLVALADVQVARELAAHYGVAGYDDYRQLLERRDIDAVVIATPTHTHVQVVCAAAAAAKHILCEKPLALTLEGCDQAIAAAQKAGVKLQVGFMRRYDEAYLTAKRKIDEGVIGTPVLFKSLSRDPARTSLEFAMRENSGGLIADMAIHDFDLAQWLIGSPIVRVQSEGGCLVYPELAQVGDIDNAVVNLKFANGAVGNIDVSRNAVYGYDIRTEVLGSKGSVMIGTLQHTPLLVLTRAGVTHDTIADFTGRFEQAYAAQLRDFVSCICQDRAPTVSGQDARLATAVAIAATKSLDEGRAVEVQEVLGLCSRKGD